MALQQPATRSALLLYLHCLNEFHGADRAFEGVQWDSEAHFNTGIPT